LHSFYLHRFEYTSVRVVSEISSVILVFQAICFQQCAHDACSPMKQSIVFSIVTEFILGSILQICDNFMTFQRYNQVITRKASALHKRLAFTWWFLFMWLTWWPFQTIVPLWYDDNPEEWLLIQLIVARWIYFGAFLLFNIFYFVLVSRELLKLRRVVSSSSGILKRTTYLTGVGVRGGFHILASSAGICVYISSIQNGFLIRSILVAGSIHFFLNFKFKTEDVIARGHRLSGSLHHLPRRVGWVSSLPIDNTAPPHGAIIHVCPVVPERGLPANPIDP
jgi:hypothetical protein